MARKYPAIFALAAVVTGIVFADNFDIASWIFLFFALSLIPLLIFYFLRTRTLIAGAIGLFCLAALSAFAYTFRVETFPPGHIVHYADDNQIYTIYGTVSDWPDIKPNQTNVIIDVDSLGLGGQIKYGMGRLLLKIAMETTHFGYGDRLIYRARIYSIKGGENQTGFSYRRYLNLKGVFGTSYLPNIYSIQVDPVSNGNFYQIIGDIRAYVTSIFERTLEEKPAALASGFLIGETRNIPVETYNLFRDSGTLHLLAVSGSNVALVVGFFLIFLRASPLKIAGRTIILLIIILLFSFLSYNQPSVVRASVMATLVIFGKALQRRIELNNIIAATALIILVFKPTELFDVGFQLSFATAWGLIFFVPKIGRLFGAFRTRRVYKLAVLPVVVCAIAQIVSLPLSAYYFQRFPIISFVSNLVIVPLVSILVIGEIVILLGSLLLPILGVFIGSLVNPLFVLTLHLLEFFGSDSLNMLLEFKVSPWLLAVYFTAGIMLYYSIHSLKIRRITAVYILVIANILVLANQLDSHDNNSMKIMTAPGGLIAVNETGSSQIIMSDFVERDYNIADLIIKPYLKINRIIPSKIIVLSADYATVREGMLLAEDCNGSAYYLWSKSSNMLKDLCQRENVDADSLDIRYYGRADFDKNIDGSGVFLARHFIYFGSDSSAIIFTESNIGERDLAQIISNLDSSKTYILIKPRLSGRDFRQILDSRKRFSHIIYTKVAPGFRKEIAKYGQLPKPIPKLVDLSQVGVINMVMGSGQIYMRD